MILLSPCLSDGDLLLFKPPSFVEDSTATISTDDFEEMGCISSGCRSLAASPDEELLLLLTGDSTFVLMTASDFDPITEDSFADVTRQESEAFVNVGWGKKETQVRDFEEKDLLVSLFNADLKRRSG